MLTRRADPNTIPTKMDWHKVMFEVKEGELWTFRVLMADPSFAELTEDGFVRAYSHIKKYNKSIMFITERRVPLDARDETLRPASAQSALV